MAKKNAKTPARPASKKPKLLAMLWYEPFAYPRVRRMMTDGKSFPPTYQGWLSPAEHAERKHKAEGCRVLRVTLDPDAFRSWCAAAGLRRDSEARAAYARAEAKEALRKQR